MIDFLKEKLTEGFLFPMLVTWRCANKQASKQASKQVFKQAFNQTPENFSIILEEARYPLGNILREKKKLKMTM